MDELLILVHKTLDPVRYKQLVSLNRCSTAALNCSTVLFV